MTRFLLLSDSCGFIDVGRSFWQEDGSVLYNRGWSSLAQSFSGPSPVGLATIFYCLRFETSFFVSSYDSQGYGGGIQPRLHTGFSLSLRSRSRSHIATDGQSVSQSVSLGVGHHDQIYISIWQLRFCFCGAPSLTKERVCLLYMLLVLASAVFLGSESLGTRDHILLSQTWDFPFCRLLRLAGSQNYSSQSQSHIATDGQSVSLGVEPHLGLMTRYLVLFDSYGLVLFVRRPLWREGGSVFCQSHCLH
jgi:hypothetical protein